jgi:ABC-type nitrate/sulfonate/bicarbonate transport system ATPase subunit
MTAALQVRELSKEFESKGRRTMAIDGIDLHVDEGEFVCLVGASGCGKSTLLNIIAGLTEPTAGGATLGGRPILGPGPDRGIVFQSYSLYPWRTVAQNVAFGLEVAGFPRDQIKDRVDHYLDVMNLQKWAGARPSQLSGGMRQRVAIARSIAAEPEMLLLDEPFGALDAHTRGLMQEYLLKVWRQTGTTILMVTHDVDEAIFLAQRIYVLSSHPGRVRTEITIPFGSDRNPAIRRDTRFLDLKDEIHAMLLAEVSEV